MNEIELGYFLRAMHKTIVGLVGVVDQQQRALQRVHTCLGHIGAALALQVGDTPPAESNLPADTDIEGARRAIAELERLMALDPTDRKKTS